MMNLIWYCLAVSVAFFYAAASGRSVGIRENVCRSFWQGGLFFAMMSFLALAAKSLGEL